MRGGGWRVWTSSCLQTQRRAPQLVSAFCAAAGHTVEEPLFTIDPKVLTGRLEKALKERNAEEAWRALQKLKRAGVEFAEKPMLRDSVALFCGGDALCLLRAQKILSRLYKGSKLDCLDGDLMKSLCWAFAKGDMWDLSANTFRLMLQKHYYPSLDFWKMLLASWAQSPRGAGYVVKVFLEICRYCCNSSLEHLTEVPSMRPDKESFTIALKACADLGESGKAEEIMRQMTRFSLQPDNACFCSLMKAHEKGGGIESMLKVLLRMKQAQEVPSRTTLNSLLAACINIGEVDVAAEVALCWSGKMRHDIQNLDLPREAAHHKLHESIRDWRDVLERPCGETFTLLLNAYLQKNRVADAAKFLGRMFHSESSQYIPCSFALEGALQLGLRDEINGTLQELASQNTPADCEAYAALVKAYCKLPQPLKAETVLQDARQVGHLVDMGCYVSVIDAYNLLQDYDCAQRVFRDMKRNGVAPLEPILNKLLSFFEKQGKPYVMSKLLDSALREPPLNLELQHWNRTVQSYCKGKLLFDAKAAVKKMRQAGFEPDANTYTFLLGGYILMGNKTNEILLLWAEIKTRLASSSNSTSPLKLNEELLNAFLTFFIKYGYFRNALDVIAKMEEHKFWADKQKYKNMYWHLHRDLYTSKHRSQRRVDMSQERRKEVEAFKLWVGLPVSIA
ncbi:hypothetical protein GOP47_0029522 [Adiantum capillus-veneris]|nr:hypothetical protein GOP47_0029522 [Adiantum capillus-veneris]